MHQTVEAYSINAATVLVDDVPVRAPLDPRASFLIAHERLALLAGAARAPAVVVGAVDPHGRVLASLRLTDRQALVIGRHTRCGLQLDAPTVSLRHVAALVRFTGTGPKIHLLDLATGDPFTTEDGRRSAGVIADGPLYASIGGYALWFVPTSSLAGGPARAEDAWSTLAPRSFLERRAPGDGPGGGAVQPSRTRVIETSVTHLEPPLLLDDGDRPERSWGKLRFEIAGHCDERWVSAERLDRGILLGRYERCGVLLDTPQTSRVHALLLRLGEDVWIIDTASTNGTRRGSRRLAAEVLPDADRLMLGRQVALEWQRIGCSAARTRPSPRWRRRRRA